MKFALAILVLSFTSTTFAADSKMGQAGDKVDAAATNTGIEMKKGARKVKRHARKATGNNTVGDDVKDTVNDAKDNAHKK